MTFKRSEWPGRAIPKQVWLTGVAALVLLLVLPLPLLNSTITVLLAAVIAYPLSLLARLTGIMSLAAAPLALIGGYGGAVLSKSLGLPFLVTLAGCAVLGAAFGLLMALPALRWNLLYTLVGTLAAVYIVNYLAGRFGEWIGEPYGLSFADDSIFGLISVSTPQFMFAALCILLLINLRIAFVLPRSNIGRDWLADAANTQFSASLGISHGTVLLKSFALTSSLICVGGCLQGYLVGIVQYESFDILMSIEFLAIIILGGLTSPWGPLLGAVLYVVLPTALGNVVSAILGGGATSSQYGANLGAAIFGALAIAVLLFEPRGLAFLLSRLYRLVSSRLSRLGMARRRSEPVAHGGSND